MDKKVLEAQFVCNDSWDIPGLHKQGHDLIYKCPTCNKLFYYNEVLFYKTDHTYKLHEYNKYGQQIIECPCGTLMICPP